MDTEHYLQEYTFKGIMLVR